MTNNDAKLALDTLKLTFLNGKFWNHNPSDENDPESVTNTACNHHGNCSTSGSCGCNSFAGGIQCFAFALYMANRVFDSFPTYSSATSPNGGSCGNGWMKYNRGYTASLTLEPGDIIRTGNSDLDGHSAIVWSVNNDIFQVGEVWGNPRDPSKNCQINWGNFNGSSSNRSISQMVNNALYIIKSPKTYKIKNAGSGKYLTVMDSSATEGGRVVQLTSQSSDRQKWITLSTAGTAHIISELNSGYAIKYAPNDDSYCKIHTISSTESGAITTVSSGSYFKIKTIKSGTTYYLAADASGSNVYWTSGDSTAYQKWTFTQVN